VTLERQLPHVGQQFNFTSVVLIEGKAVWVDTAVAMQMPYEVIAVIGRTEHHGGFDRR
jgi:hypothetical protein